MIEFLNGVSPRPVVGLVHAVPHSHQLITTVVKDCPAFAQKRKKKLYIESSHTFL